jgi:hypothetical protein
MSELDISRLPFDLEVIKRIKTSEKLFEAFPVLMRYDAFKDDSLPIPFPRAFELIVLLYSMGSPLIIRHDTCKPEAAEYFGYRVVDGKIMDQDIEDLLYCQHELFNDMIIAYCRLQKNAKFSKLVTYTDAYYATLTKIRSGGSDKEKIKELLLAADKLENDIDVLVNEFLNHDNSVGLRDKVFDEVEIASLGLRPEEIAEKLELGQEAVDIKPYGKEYNFKKFGDRTKVNPLSND